MGAHSILLRDVTARDGIQNEQPISLEARIELVNRLVDSGVRSLEVGSFVRDDIIPAMANTAEVFAQIAEALETAVTVGLAFTVKFKVMVCEQPVTSLPVKV